MTVVDMPTRRAPRPLDDDARVAALHRLGVLDQPAAADLEGLTRLAAFVAGAPVSVLNLIDAERQWQAAATGMTRIAVPREEAMCSHTVAEDRFIHVADASADQRFASSAFVDGRLADVRMYASVPVHDRDGYPVGSLCVVDPLVRSLSADQRAALADLALQAEALLEMRRQYLVLLDVLAEADHDARHDPLTGLPNRRVLMDRLDNALARAVRTKVPPHLFYCDLDGFKALNDSAGHQAGDETLIAVGRQLQHLVRPHDTVSRLGGDEFVVLCEDLAPEDAETVAARLRQHACSTSSVQVSIGTHRAEPGSSAAQALRGADLAMYGDKLRRRAARVRQES